MSCSTPYHIRWLRLPSAVERAVAAALQRKSPRLDTVGLILRHQQTRPAAGVRPVAGVRPALARIIGPPGGLKASRADILAEVHGRVTYQHRFLLELHLTEVDALRAAVEKLERRADEVLRPFREAADRLTTMPVVSEAVARVVISGSGVDMAKFPSAGHLVT